MEIKWFGQSCFLIKSKHGKIVIDPYSPKIGLKLPKLQADVLLISHSHSDHNFREGVSASSGEELMTLDGPGEYEVGEIIIEGINSYHDKQSGAQRGENTIFVIQDEEMRICHLGDLGEVLQSKQLDALDGIDILLVPVGGKYTLEIKEVSDLLNDIDPKIVIPMHYKIPGITIDFAPLDHFLKEEGISSPKKTDVLNIKKLDLPSEEREIIILEQNK